MHWTRANSNQLVVGFYTGGDEDGLEVDDIFEWRFIAELIVASKKMGHPWPLFHIFSAFSNKQYKLYNKLI